MTELVVPDLVLPDRRLCGNGRASIEEIAALRRQARADAVIVGSAAVLRHVAEHRTSVPVFPKGTRVGVKLRVVYSPLTYVSRPLDDDNFWRGMKSILDGLAEVGVVANDKQLYMDGEIEWLAVPTYHQGSVTATFRAKEES